MTCVCSHVDVHLWTGALCVVCCQWCAGGGACGVLVRVLPQKDPIEPHLDSLILVSFTVNEWGCEPGGASAQRRWRV